MSVYRRRDNGKWLIDITYNHPDGRKEIIRKVSPVNTKRGAEQYETQLRQEMLKRDSLPQEKPPAPRFREYAESFMTEYARVENKPSEVISKERILKNHLYPVFARKPLDRITRDDIKAYRSKKLRAGLSPKTINNHVTVLTRILGEAVESGLIPFVPRVRRLKVPPPQFDYLLPEEAHQLVEAAEGLWQVMILLALSTGLRQGELLALQWQDIDLAKRFLIVRHSLFRGRVGTPKSNKERILPLNGAVIEALSTLKKSKSGFLFTNSKGKPLTDNECKWPIKKACSRAGIRQISWHVLRHTFASHLVQAGVSIMEVQRYLGHADIRTTQRYAHLNPQISHVAVEKLPSYRTYIAQNVVQFRNYAESQ